MSRPPKRVYLDPRGMTEDEIVDAFMALIDDQLDPSSAASTTHRPNATREVSQPAGTVILPKPKRGTPE